jgi:hypothetical protein
MSGYRANEAGSLVRPDPISRFECVAAMSICTASTDSRKRFLRNRASWAGVTFDRPKHMFADKS